MNEAERSGPLVQIDVQLSHDAVCCRGSGKVARRSCEERAAQPRSELKQSILSQERTVEDMLRRILRHMRR